MAKKIAGPPARRWAKRGKGRQDETLESSIGIECKDRRIVRVVSPVLARSGAYVYAKKGN